MEQQTQERARQGTESRAPERRDSRIPERERLSDAGLTARAALAGLPLLDLPPARLEELAGWIGNQNMEELLERQAPPLAEHLFLPPGEAPETEPFLVPGEAPALTEPPQALTVETVSRAFAPKGLLYGGGEVGGAGV